MAPTRKRSTSFEPPGYYTKPLRENVFYVLSGHKFEVGFKGTLTRSLVEDLQT